MDKPMADEQQEEGMADGMKDGQWKMGWFIGVDNEMGDRMIK
jgi:hypothetical protein